VAQAEFCIHQVEVVMQHLRSSETR
jgi:hypothetical protein